MAARLSDRERGQGDAGHVGNTLVTLMPRLVTRSANYLKLLAGGPGFEPRMTESESAVLANCDPLIEEYGHATSGNGFPALPLSHPVE